MRKKLMKGMMTALLSVSVSAMLLAGCGANSGDDKAVDQSKNETEEATSGSNSESAAEADAFTYPMDTDTTITYWCDLNTNVAANYANLGETPFGKGLMEHTGVNIDFQHPPTGQGEEQFNLMLADGDLPDLLEYHWMNYTGGPEKAITDGYIYELTEIIDKYCPNLKAYLEANPDIDRMVKTDEGHYYMFPFIRGDEQLRVTLGLMVRQDWLDELGLEVPTTMDEWHEVLTQFKEKKGAQAPFSYEYTMGSLTDDNPFCYAYGATRNFYLGDDGQVHYGAVEDGYKQYLETMHQWYEEGLIDPDIATQQFDQVSAKMTNGTSGASIGWAGSRMGVWTTAAIETEPNYALSPAPVPTLNKGDRAPMGQIDNAVPNQGGVAITTSCKDIEAAARLLDWAYSEEGHMFYNFGVEGESYTLESGEPVYTDQILKNPDGLPVAQAMSAYIRGNYNGPFVQDIRYLRQYYTYDGQKASNAIWGDNDGKLHKLPPITPTSDESDQFSAIMNEISTYRDEMTIKYILGTEDIGTFDSYVSTIDSMGLAKALEIENAALSRYKER
ncbi:MAG: extracellular solute-binding protein [Butyrivibrio sp.]|nr:extracellular solute-binding protein [Butyrivibrio sp.]